MCFSVLVQSEVYFLAPVAREKHELSVDYLSFQRIEALFWRVLVIAACASNLGSAWLGGSEAFNSHALAFFSVTSAALASGGAIEVVALWRVQRRIRAMTLGVSTVVAAIVTCAVQVGYVGAHVKVALLQVGPLPIGFDFWVLTHGLGQPLLCMLLPLVILSGRSECEAEAATPSTGREPVSSRAALDGKEPECMSGDASLESVACVTSVRQPLAFGAHSMPYTRSYAYCVPSQAAAEAGRDRCPIPSLCRRSISRRRQLDGLRGRGQKYDRVSQSLNKTRAPLLSPRLRDPEIRSTGNPGLQTNFSIGQERAAEVCAGSSEVNLFDSDHGGSLGHRS